MSLFRASANSPRVSLAWLAAYLPRLLRNALPSAPRSSARDELPEQFIPEPSPARREAQIREVRANSRIFREKHLQRLLAEGYRDKYALMRNGEIIEIIDTEDLHTAVLRGYEVLGDKPFSTQRINDGFESV